jgi:hypothetical protein
MVRKWINPKNIFPKRMIIFFVWRTNIKDLVDAPKHLVDAYFLKPFTLIDLTRIEDEVLKKTTWAGVMELILKHQPIIQQKKTIEPIMTIMRYFRLCVLMGFLFQFFYFL